MEPKPLLIETLKNLFKRKQKDFQGDVDGRTLYEILKELKKLVIYKKYQEVY